MLPIRGLRMTSQPCFPPIPRHLSSLAAFPASPKIQTRDDPDFFRYTSGRWIYNESRRLKERILHFDVAELKKAAAAAVKRDVVDVQSFRKLGEGGFNRAFELTIDGRQVIAKLPYPSTYPKHLCVASEVATMDLVRSYGVPAPQVLGYSATSNNAVGSEYIIMEKLNGRDLGDIWYELSEKERMKVVVQVARVESSLFSIDLPACGSVYYRDDLERDTDAVNIEVCEGTGTGTGESTHRTTRQFCIGPDVAQEWWYDTRDQLSVPRGPFLQAEQTFTAGAAKELAWLKTYGLPRLPRMLPHRELHGYQKVSPADHVANIEKYLQIAPHLVPRSEEYLLRPILRHPDFQPRNIFVADDFTITGIIDWQHCSVLPLVLQAGIPEYIQNLADEESLRLKKPSLPESFDSMSDAEKAEALEQYRRRQLHYYYFVATYKYNKPHFNALCLDSTMPTQKLHQYASAPWEGDNISLKAELIRATKNWPVLTASNSSDTSDCPIHFSDEEEQACLRIEAEQNHLDVQMEMIRDRIGVSSNGWTSNERYEDACKENDYVKEEALHGQDAATRKEILENWPLDDHDEY